ncbi:Fic family protein [Sulfurihydrogenibium azorense]|uniref:Fic family protein n=1 Tax=Sulfurihydrogenibium azorense TaxID=309806 RepID=UPI002408FCEE|nr:Fic family protein [Sulfurihydrogenibium azorense]MDM7272948.1 Fic family protein [Sulfurihydrogenibium azorense]
MIDEKLIKKRKEILENLGGLPEPKVKNKEWLYLLEEETRNSIMIEGFFISEKELKEVLSKNQPITRTEEEAFNYFRTATFIYELAYENYKQKEFLFGVPLIRQINKSLGKSGEFRKGKIKIAGAKFNPPESYIEEWVKIFVDFAIFVEKNFNLEYLSLLHGFFEEIHPFSDGNGRTGRILLNYFLISKGYPPVIIKGDEDNKKLYYKGLEEIDKQLSEIFKKYENKPPKKEEVINKLKTTKSTILKDLISESLRNSLDTIIVGIYEKLGKKLQLVSDLLSQVGYSPSSARQLIKRGKVIAVKRNNKWFSIQEVIESLLK